jgi:hypothetical protein
MSGLEVDIAEGKRKSVRGYNTTLMMRKIARLEIS